MIDLIGRGILIIISDILSILTIGFCLIQKIPQIKTLYNNKSARGISATSLYLELFSYSIMMSYNYCNRYSMLSYLEYPILLFQEYILIYLVLKYRRQLNANSYKIAGAYFFALSMFLTNIIPTFILAMLVPFCTPIGATSKVIQLYEIIRTKNATSVNLTTWMISAFTNLTRIYTVMVDSADRMLLANFSISFLLSGSIYLAAFYYKKPKVH
ncbi:hypothetical protein HA402_001484 [Bradysia odoriphaga]|nr:hypothetical protein HA402_001484 [Bradysia odoriphaga]